VVRDAGNGGKAHWRLWTSLVALLGALGLLFLVS
jgi:hypothetical protein